MSRPSPLQNRVTPSGEIVANRARGAFMGNRGILHDHHYHLGVSRWKHHAWVTCVLSFKGINRNLMSPGQYTELFFTDEAVALAAGHRPCAQCRRADYNRFQAAFSQANGTEGTKLSGPEMDKILQKSRVHSKSRKQTTYFAEFASLPEGVFFKMDGDDRAMVIRSGQVLAWSFDGYAKVDHAMSEEVEVMTPKPVVAALKAGYRIAGW